MLTLPRYVLITPARDEARFIELTIKSVVAQTVRPIRWVIVSDGSTDGTDDVVKKYAAEHPWIEFVRMPERRERHFAAKVHAFNAGYARIRDLDYQVMGSLDGNVSFDEDYFSFLLQKLAEDPTLGLVGTPFKDSSIETYDYRLVGIDHVSGFCQLFRRRCFEEIGGYVPVKGGGIDHIAVITARMKGWKTRTFTDKVCLHHRGIGTAQHSILRARFRVGVKDYALGGHPVWEFFRMLYQMTKRPFIVGGLTLGFGYLWALARRTERPIPRELVLFRRREQMQRLRRLLPGVLSRSRAIPNEYECWESGKTVTRNGDSISTPPGSLSAPSGMEDSVSPGPAGELAYRSAEGPPTGHLIINADDWGRDHETTDRTLECILRGTVSSVSAMVFMADSERAAEIALKRGIDAGLHLNFTTPFSAPNCPARLVQRQRELAAYLRRHRFAMVVFHPGLSRSFKYVIAAQLEEFSRLYGAAPGRLDGHHHMHLCANVLLGRLLPRGTIVRRNFSFQPGEKTFSNRLYRKVVDRMLARRHRLTDFFFSLEPLEPSGRLRRIFSLARQFVVEVETHPVNPEEHRFLAGGEMSRWVGGCPIAPRFAMRSEGVA